MSKRTALTLSAASCMLALAACDRSDLEPAENDEQLRTRELPAEVAVRERVAAEERAEQGLQGSADTLPEPFAIDPAATLVATNTVQRRAAADLDTIGKVKLEAKAKLEERPEGVAVLINVEDAKPGTRSVRLYDRDCDDLDEQSLSKPLATTVKDGNLGSVTVGPSGKGTLETLAPASTLKPDDRASLLGKSIVVHERSDADSPKAAGSAIACGEIQVDVSNEPGRVTDRAQ